MAQPISDLVWISPVPPVESGISQYTLDFLRAVGPRWPLSLLAEPGAAPGSIPDVNSIRASDVAGVDQIAHVGNSTFHRHAFKFALERPGITVLHDLVLHHARLSEFVRRGKGRDYQRLMVNFYGAEGAEVASRVLRGASVDLSDYPLSEDYLTSARIAVVHSEYSRARALEIAPTSRVAVAPMGVPLPALIDRSDARAHLGIPESAFVIASITHVNPLKRLHIVLRALRRVVEKVPEALLVIAGSVAPGMNLERRVALLGLERHVRLAGYLSDDDTRILACASDVAVNLRYPSTGETSASLLRLLGAAKPVIVTPTGPTRELPEEAAIRVSVDRFEEETLTEYLLWLARDDSARREIGVAARQFVEQRHSMGAAVDAYRATILDAFGLDLPPLDDGVIHEPEPALRRPPDRSVVTVTTTPIENTIVDALAGLGLGSHDGTIQRVAESVVGLGLDQFGRGQTMETQQDHAVSPELLDILACPACKTKVKLVDGELICDTCGRRYRIENGIPIMLIEDADMDNPDE